jgi:hypothetical protein
MKSVKGRAIHEDEWTVICPECEELLHFRGFFDSSEITFCDFCHAEFIVNEIQFENGDKIC